MKKLSIALVVAGMVASATAGAADPTARLGEQATPNQAQRTIVIKPTTKYVNVTEGEVVKFVANGKTFAWNFDSPEVSSFPLNRVAPVGALSQTVTAYITPNPDLGR